MSAAEPLGRSAATGVELDVVDVRFTVGASAGYEVMVGAGALDELPRLLREYCPAHRYVVIADANVAELYGDRVVALASQVGVDVDLLTFPAGETNKTRETWARLSDEMLVLGVGRDAAVLALGGGVTGDLAGFVAATYLRGLPLVQLPTSLLAMIDSSVGGKTGVDTPAGKNLVGAFHQPAFVLADVETVRTLPAREVRAGLAEAVKHGAIADREYFEWIAAAAGRVGELEPAAISELIARSVRIKAAVVSADEREGGLRKTLNFGHTLGHAFEALSRFELLHGEAIAIGMVAEARLGEIVGVTRAGTAERLRTVMEMLGLPTAIPANFEAEAILALTRVDKKARAGRVEYALIEEIGVASRGGGGYGVVVGDGEVVTVVNRPLPPTSPSSGRRSSPAAPSPPRP